MKNKTFCGKIIYKDEEYGVFIEKSMDFIWVNKTNEETFGVGNYGSYTARNEKEALELAPEMIENIGK